MSSIPAIMKDARVGMERAIENTRKEFASIRTGKASTALLDTVRVEAYGQHLPLNQVASVAAPEARLLTVTPWDKNLAHAIEKAIRDSDLGLNPASQGAVIRVPIPALNEERRRDLAKVLHKLAEEGRIAVRHARTEGQLDRDRSDRARCQPQQVSSRDGDERLWLDAGDRAVETCPSGRGVEEHGGDTQTKQPDDRRVERDGHRAEDERAHAGAQAVRPQLRRGGRSGAIELGEGDRPSALDDGRPACGLGGPPFEDARDVHPPPRVREPPRARENSAYRRMVRAYRSLILRDTFDSCISAWIAWP